jgi:hypothetical protein
MKTLFLLAVGILMVWAIVHSTRRDIQAFDEHMRIQDSLDVVAKRSRDSLRVILDTAGATYIEHLCFDPEKSTETRKTFVPCDEITMRPGFRI